MNMNNKNQLMTLGIVFLMGLLIGGTVTGVVMHLGRNAQQESPKTAHSRDRDEEEEEEEEETPEEEPETPPEEEVKEEAEAAPETPEEQSAEEEESEEEEEVAEYPAYMQENRSCSRTDQITEKDDNGNLKVDELPGNAIQIVVFGDSMWDNFREEDGLAARLMDYNSNYEVYNMAFGASTATRLEENSHETDKKTLTTLVDIAIKHEGNVVPESYTRNSIEKCNFLRTNYFVIAYGINDLFEGKPIWNPYFSPDKTCYTGAIIYAIQELKNTYPNARIIVIPPTYVNGNPKNQFGTMDDYRKAAEQVANENGALFFDAVPFIGMTTDNANDYCVDGTHLNADSRAIYAENLGKFILQDWNR